ncbi:family 78 glycoside hydrolase catalytic domain [Kineococcus sp. SYSU DK003]|uniref:family 78 glycoside hydrolase catalytic domain n=1 Tax=Kineococcus sp. SYSU DK003 TaxID=3383124 RepID=UPI003D7CEA1E
MSIPLDVTVERLHDPRALWTPRPRYSWTVPREPGSRPPAQLAHSVQVREAGTGRVLWDAGRVASGEQVLLAHAGEDLASNCEYDVQVRTWYDDGSERTGRSRIGTSLLHPEDWNASSWVEPVQEPVTPDGAERFHQMFSWRPQSAPEERLHPPLRVRQVFEVPSGVVRARLYATAQGVYAAWVNGERAGDEELAPGSDSYTSHLSFQGYDVTAALRPGTNVVALEVADGWFAGRVGMFGLSREYGERLRVRWQLHLTTADGTTTVVGSSAAARSGTGPIRYSDLAIGEFHDDRYETPGWDRPGFDDSAWEPVRECTVGTPLVPFVGEPVRRVAELPAVEVLTTPSGDRVVDFGQVIAGRVRLRTPGGGARVVLEHTEVLDARGEFFFNLFGPNKDQTDVHVAGPGGPRWWEPRHTFHGFRYVRVSGLDEVRAEDFVAVVLSSDLPQRADFASSDPRLDRLFQNVVWSQRSNFLSIPTDCPQRERLGWTGDAQVFAPTAATLAGVGNFFARWMANVRADQRPDGAVPNIVPWPPALEYLFGEPAPSYSDDIMVLTTSAAWGDAVVLVPWAVHGRDGDVGILRENFEAMRRWVGFQTEQCRILPERLRGTELTAAQRERQDLLWNGVAAFGDWLAPSTLTVEGPTAMMEAPRRTGEAVSAIYHGYVSGILADVARLLGEDEVADACTARALAVREAVAAEYLDERGRFSSDLQGVAVLALHAGVVPERLRQVVADRLAASVRANGNHLDTGFVAVPFLLDVLADHGHLDVARDVLFQDTYPSWLYEVAAGATTIWESWDAVRPDGTVQATSYNHYAYGCVADWMVRRLGGIAPAAPGYRVLRVEPDVLCGLDHVRVHVDTPYGRAESGWRVSQGALRLELTVPAGCTAELVLPPELTGVQVRGADLLAPGAWTGLAAGSYVVTASLAAGTPQPVGKCPGDRRPLCTSEAEEVLEEVAKSLCRAVT